MILNFNQNHYEFTMDRFLDFFSTPKNGSYRDIIHKDKYLVAL